MPKLESSAGNGASLTLAGVGARGTRLHQGRLREVPVRRALRPDPDVPAADARVPLDHPAAEGGAAEPRLARRRVRHRRLHLPAGARERCDLGRAGDRLDHLVDPVDDLRVPLRHLDGLRGVHAHAHPRGVRRDGRHAVGRRARPRAHGQARHERGCGADARVLLALDRARPRHQAVRDRSRRRRHLRRDRDPRAARAVDDAAARPLELDLPAARGAPPARRAQRDVTPFADGIWLKREDEHELGAFKWRGAAAVLDALRPDAVVTASTGNHGAATAWAAKQAGIRAIVFVPREAERREGGARPGAGRRALPRRRRHGRGEGGGARLRRRARPVLLRGRQRAVAVRGLRGDRRRAARRAAGAGRRRRPGRERRPRDRRLPCGCAPRTECAARRRRRGRGPGDVGELARRRAGRLRPRVDLRRRARRPRRDPARRRRAEPARPAVRARRGGGARGRPSGRTPRPGIRAEGAAAAPLALALRETLPRPTVLIVTGRNIDDALYNRLLSDRT